MPALYANLLGPAWPDLAPAVRRLHGGGGQAEGVFRVRHGTSWPARFVSWLLRMPRVSEGCPVRLQVETIPDGELWRRTFAGAPLVTYQAQEGAFLLEAMGLFQCFFRLSAVDGALIFEQVGAALGYRSLAIPLPRFLAPFVEGRAAPERDDVRVDVRIHAPVVGLLVAYDGLVSPQSAEPAP